MLDFLMSSALYSRARSLASMSTLAQRVTEAVLAAKAAGNPVSKIAKACGIKPQSVYQWMDSSTHTLKGENLVELAEASGYRAMWIIKGKGPKFDPPIIRRAIQLLHQIPADRQELAIGILAQMVDVSGPESNSTKSPQKAGKTPFPQSTNVPITTEAP